jgi:hypothetical protein
MNTMNMPGFTAEAALGKTSGHYRIVGIPHDMVGRHGAMPQLQNQDDWTTDKICKACGCKVNGFICDCGLRPRPDKLECIRNGGPARAVSVRA